MILLNQIHPIETTTMIQAARQMKMLEEVRMKVRKIQNQWKKYNCSDMGITYVLLWKIVINITVKIF